MNWFFTPPNYWEKIRLFTRCQFALPLWHVRIWHRPNWRWHRFLIKPVNLSISVIYLINTSFSLFPIVNGRNFQICQKHRNQRYSIVVPAMGRMKTVWQIGLYDSQYHHHKNIIYINLEYLKLLNLCGEQMHLGVAGYINWAANDVGAHTNWAAMD